MNIRRLVVLGCAATALAACEPAQPAPPAQPAEPAPAAEPAEPAPPPAPAQPAGPAETLVPAEDPNLQWSASVHRLHAMEDQSAKVFGVAGGDPALNGLHTYLGLFRGPAEGWRVFSLGDFEDWRVVEQGDGRVVLEVRQSRIDDAGGGVVTETRRLIVQWTGPQAERITLAPAA